MNFTHSLWAFRFQTALKRFPSVRRFPKEVAMLKKNILLNSNFYKPQGFLLSFRLQRICIFFIEVMKSSEKN